MIRSFLDVSSGHLSPETWAWLDAETTSEKVRSFGPSAQVVLASGMRYGWFVYANEEPAEGIPADLDAVFRVARQRGCEYVLFDCDAIPLEDLPILHPDFTDAALAT